MVHQKCVCCDAQYESIIVCPARFCNGHLTAYSHWGHLNTSWVFLVGLVMCFLQDTQESEHTMHLHAAAQPQILVHPLQPVQIWLERLIFFYCVIKTACFHKYHLSRIQHHLPALSAAHMPNFRHWHIVETISCTPKANLLSSFHTAHWLS